MTDVLSQRVADLAALTQAQRDALRALAAADPSEAEDRLQMLLRRWSEPMLRRYIADVLVGGADHDAWIAQHHVFPTRKQELEGLLGRSLTDSEQAPASGIAAFAPRQQALGAHVRARHGRLAAKAYLQLVVPDANTDALTDYVDCVLNGKLSHAAWVAGHLPWFATSWCSAP